MLVSSAYEWPDRPWCCTILSIIFPWGNVIIFPSMVPRWCQWRDSLLANSTVQSVQYNSSVLPHVSCSAERGNNWLYVRLSVTFVGGIFSTKTELRSCGFHHTVIQYIKGCFWNFTVRRETVKGSEKIAKLAAILRYISEMIQSIAKRTRPMESEYKLQSHIRSIKWCHLQWPLMTLTSVSRTMCFSKANISNQNSAFYIVQLHIIH